MIFTRDEFVAKVPAWFPNCYETHMMLLDELDNLPWGKDLRYETTLFQAMPTLLVSQGPPSRRVSMAVALSSFRTVSAGFLPQWSAECNFSHGHLRCKTTDLPTIAFFLRRLPLFAPDLIQPEA